MSEIYAKLAAAITTICCGVIAVEFFKLLQNKVDELNLKPSTKALMLTTYIVVASFLLSFIAAYVYYWLSFTQGK